MLEWLGESLNDSGGIAPELLARRLILSCLLGGVVALIYALTLRKSRAELVPFVTTLVLLTVLITMVTLVIGNSVARAFSLVGALAIVRFRTVVEDTRETAFVIFAVVVGMGVGVGGEVLLVPVVGIPVVAAAALALSGWGRLASPVAREFTLAIRLGIGRDPAVLFREAFGKRLLDVRLKALTTARQGAALDLSYLVRLRREEDGLSFVNELNQIEGVQSVELREV